MRATLAAAAHLKAVYLIVCDIGWIHDAPTTSRRTGNPVECVLGEGRLVGNVTASLFVFRSTLAPARKVRAATANYRAEMDWMSAFLTERCVIKDGAKTMAADLYTALIKWWQLDDDTPPSQKEFGRRLGTAGLRREKKSGYYWWFGITLK